MRKNLLLGSILIFASFVPAEVFCQHAGEVPGQHSSVRMLPGAAGVAIQMTDDLHDHLGRVFAFQGDVRILKKRSEDWAAVEKDMLIEEGDQVLTGRDSFLDVSYDNHFLNIARIDANTKAEFLSIEPTIVRLQDGSIFSALDGLGKGDGYQVATPTAVAGVRGTHFNVSFLEGKFSAATLPVEEDGHESFLEIKPVGEEGEPALEATPLMLPEGRQFDLVDAASFDPLDVREIDPETAARGKLAFVEMSLTHPDFESLREEGQKYLGEQNSEEEKAPELKNEDSRKTVGNDPPNQGGPGTDSGPSLGQGEMNPEREFMDPPPLKPVHENTADDMADFLDSDNPLGMPGAESDPFMKVLHPDDPAPVEMPKPADNGLPQKDFPAAGKLDPMILNPPVRPDEFIRDQQQQERQMIQEEMKHHPPLPPPPCQPWPSCSEQH